MMLRSLLLCFIFCLTLSASAQTFYPLTSDPQGDPTVNFGLDAKALSFAFDESQDSLWFKLETYDTIKVDKDWGFAIVIDTNEIPSDGLAWSGSSNTSMGYERKIMFLNNKFFPPTFTSLTDHNLNSITTSISFQIPDPFTLILNVKLSDIDDDIGMNIVAGTGSFDEMIYDDLPDATFVNTTTVLGGTVCDCYTPITEIFPNPANGELNVMMDSFSPVQLNVLTVQGSLIYSEKINTSTRIETENWDAGMYILQWQNPNGSLSSQKFSVMH